MKRRSPSYHAGSMQGLISTMNFILTVFKRGLGSRPGDFPWFWLPEEMFTCIAEQVREDFECRSLDQVVEYYTSVARSRSAFLSDEQKTICGAKPSPMNCAAHEGDFKALRLMSHDPGLSLDKTAILAACARGHEKCLEVLQSQCDFINHRTCDVWVRRNNVISGDYHIHPSWRTAAHYAAENGHDGCLLMLKAAGYVNLEAEDIHGMTPLLVAAENGHEGCLMILKQAGCDLRHKDRRGSSAAHFAGHEGVLLILKKEGLDLGEANHGGETPAHCAAMKGNEACLRFLHRAGCDLGYQDGLGFTPAIHAAKNGHEGCLKYLEQAGCDLEHRGDKDATAAHWAALNGHAGCLRVLKEAGCDLDAMDACKGTPLMYAYRQGHKDCEKICIS